MTKDKYIETDILQRFPVDNAIQLYFWYGFMQPTPGKSTVKLTLNFIRLFQPEYVFWLYLVQEGSLFLFILIRKHHLLIIFISLRPFLTYYL